MNKSQIARDFWRRLFDENKIDLRSADARNNAVNLFLDENKKTWRKADRRFFRLGFSNLIRNLSGLNQFHKKPKRHKEI